MSVYDRMTRRGFLKNSSAAVAALGAATVLRPQTARSAEQVAGANERVRVGLIGAGGMGSYNIGAMMGNKPLNVEIAAACDIAEFRLNAVAKMTQEGQGKACKTVMTDYRALLDDKSIDAILIATPDLWHFQPYCDSLDAGKHVFQQKPMCYTIEQGLEMVKRAKAHPKQIVQIGTQRRSGLQYPKARAFVEQGKLGKITYVRCWDTRNWIHNDPFAPRPFEGKVDWDHFQKSCKMKVAFDPWRYFAWRWYWDYAGGLVTDVGIHVMDVVHWLTGNDTPKNVVCNGGVYGMKYWETPDVVNSVWDYGTHSIEFTGNFTNGQHGDGLNIYGTEATLEVRGHDIVITAENDKRDVIAEFKAEIQSHEANWIDCIRSGKAPNAPAELGFKSLLPLLLGNLAYRSGKKLSWDAENQKVVGL